MYIYPVIYVVYDEIISKRNKGLGDQDAEKEEGEDGNKRRIKEGEIEKMYIIRVSFFFFFFFVIFFFQLYCCYQHIAYKRPTSRKLFWMIMSLTAAITNLIC